MASVEIVCTVLSQDGEYENHVFHAYTNPVFFDLWARCPTVVLSLPGGKVPFTDMDAPLMSLSSHVFEAHDWRAEHAELRSKFKIRLYNMMRVVVAKRKADMHVEYAILLRWDRHLVDYIGKLESGTDADDQLLNF